MIKNRHEITEKHVAVLNHAQALAATEHAAKMIELGKNAEHAALMRVLELKEKQLDIELKQAQLDMLRKQI